MTGQLIGIIMIGSAGLVFLALLIFAIFIIVDDAWKSSRKIDPSEEKSFFWLRWKAKRKEIALMKEILKDIKENRQDWMEVHRNLQFNEKKFIVNDKTGLGFRAGETAGIYRLTIINNLVENGEFAETGNTVIAIEIEGSHVIWFMRKALDLMKTREAEIDTFVSTMRKEK